MRLYKLAIEINADNEVSYFAGYIDYSKTMQEGMTHTTVITAEQFHDMLQQAENNATQPMDNDDNDSDE